MSVSAYYNEHDPYAAQWLRNLIAAGHIAPGHVDERSIEDVAPEDLLGYRQCHFFAGIGVWSHALRGAGWADDLEVWTGSCPCQPFSAAGKGGGFADERHLWPAFHWLIEQCRPRVVVGEQVASRDGLAWLDVVLADLDGAGYTGTAVDLCAAGFGAPHIRQRLYWMAYPDGSERWPGHQRNAIDDRETGGRIKGSDWSRECRVACALADADSESAGRNAGSARRSETSFDGQDARDRDRSRHGGDAGFWANADWIPCRDGKARPVEPGTFPLAHGASARVGRLRAYGNAIVAPVAQGFIEAVMECIP